MPSAEQDYDLVQRRVQTEVLGAADSPNLERDDIRVEISLLDPESYPDELPPCSEGH